MNFSEQLVLWYEKNKRDLPWRETKNPYYIWLSEIILQQTRVNQGRDYYDKFISSYPTIIDLANADEQEVLKLWQGLGYYSRARNLHFTAKYIATNLNGVFPTSHSEIIKLKGVGEYTAAAIASFAYNLPFPVVDGNVFRVLTRFFGITIPIDSIEGKKTIYNLANELIIKKQASIFNQAIMEFGALQCVPKNPSCFSCIFNITCFAYKNKLINELPTKSKKTKQRNRFFNYLVFISPQHTTIIKKRTEKDIWKNLFDFPLIESENLVDSLDELSNYKQFNDVISEKKSLSLINKFSPAKHILSHQIINATFWIIETPSLEKLKTNQLEIDIKSLSSYPVSVLIANFISNFSTIKPN